MSTAVHTPQRQSVLRCEQCRKPFDKHATLKRHRYYCRSRMNSNVKSTRVRSCLACAKAKTGCDHSLPQCSRCVAKGIRCQYPDLSSTLRKAGGGRREFQQCDEIEVESRVGFTPPIVSPDSLFPVTEHHGEISGEDLIPDFSVSEDNRLGWNEASIGFAGFLSPQNINMTTTSPTFPLSVLPSHPPQTIDTTTAGYREDEVQPSLQIMNTASSSLTYNSIPRSPSSTVRSLIRRPQWQQRPQTTTQQRIQYLILHTLKSYPLMMRRRDTLPPFIHPSLVDGVMGQISDGTDKTSPLTNCMVLVHMLGSDVRGSRRLFWRNVRMECERLLSEEGKLDKWALLTAMQALTIYILVRVDERDDTEDNDSNIDLLLIKTIISIIQQFYFVDMSCDGQCGLCNGKHRWLSWKEWIFRESRRRLAIIYRVVNKLIYFEPGSMCDMPSEFVLAPLPAAKSLWEARDERSWLFNLGSNNNDDNDGNDNMHLSFGLRADGNVVRLDGSRLSCRDVWISSPPPHQKSFTGGKGRSGAQRRDDDDDDDDDESEKGWQEWCAGMDGLGGLVMLAASMLS
ncbi:hypothetical protein F5Y17DRAFT_429881 [Xylariaceae sp. FL0594]|nr:hypothetical protein F5Y17DRAFT_429881 [Xylariaceae sp. FL0594]